MLTVFFAFTTLTAWLQSPPPPPQEIVITYEIEAGDTLSSIANDHDIEVEGLWAANDEIEDPHLISIGQKLVIPRETLELEVVSLPQWRPYVAPIPSPSASSSPPRTAAATPLTSGIPWDRLAECESNQRWGIDAHAHRGGPYHDARFYGGLQFNKMSWDWAVDVGGHNVPYWPHHATREQQIMVAETLLRIHPAGIRAWPACASKLGLG